VVNLDVVPARPLELALSGTLGDLVVASLIGVTGLSWWAIYDILRRRDDQWPADGLSRLAWGLIVLLVPFAAILYLFVGPPAKLGSLRRAPQT